MAKAKTPATLDETANLDMTIQIISAIDADDPDALLKLVPRKTFHRYYSTRFYVGPILSQAIVKKAQRCSMALLVAGSPFTQETINLALLHRLNDAAKRMIGRRVSESQCWVRSATQYRNLEMIRHFAAMGANLNQPFDEFGKTPLMHAAEHGATELVIQLLDLGANVSIKNKRGWTAKTYAVYKKDADLIGVFAAHEAREKLKKMAEAKTSIRALSKSADGVKYA